MVGRSRKGSASVRRDRRVRRREFLLSRRHQWETVLTNADLETLTLTMWELDLIDPTTETLQNAMRDVKGFIGMLKKGQDI